MVLLHTVWEFMESPAHHLILVHQTDEASCCPNPEFPNETAWTEGSGIILLWVFSCRCRKLIKPLIHLISPAPWVCQLFQGEIAKVTIPCAVRKKSHFCSQSWGWPSLSHLCQCHIHHLANSSQVLCYCSWSYPWNSQDPSTFFWATDHQQLTLTGHSFLSLVFRPWISIIYVLKTTTEFTFISIPTKILSSCCISAVICSIPKDREHWVGDTILQCH